MDSCSSSALTDTIMFFSRLAWNCRISLPVLVTITFMALDFRMQLEINVETQRVQNVHLFDDDEDEFGDNMSEFDVEDDDTTEDGYQWNEMSVATDRHEMMADNNPITT